MPDLQLSPIRNIHIDVMHTLHNECFDAPWSRETFEATFESPMGLFGLLALYNEAPCGFIWGRCLYDELEILTLCVGPQYRSQGIAKQLIIEMRHMFPAAKIFLEVAVDNAAALHVYRSLGFVETGTRKNYYARNDGTTVDAKVMTLQPA